MKKNILLIALSSFIIFTNCKKKTDDPAPVITAPANPFGTTSGISSNGKITPLTTTAYSSTGAYIIEGTNKTDTLDVTFPNGMPTKSSTVDLSKSDISIEYYSSTSDFTATSGTANIVVGDTIITVTFTDAVFSDGTTTTKYSGQLIVSSKKTTIVTPTYDGTGTATVGGTTSDLLIISSTSSSTGAYSITGMIAGTQNSVLLLFTNGKPTTSSTEDLSSSDKIKIAYNTSSTQYISKAGTATISVSTDGAVTVTFTNATLFDTNNSNTTIAMSANITATK
jgi:hypothetical protein